MLHVHKTAYLSEICALKVQIKMCDPFVINRDYPADANYLNLMLSHLIYNNASYFIASSNVLFIKF